jgi:hypothetical protein
MRRFHLALAVVSGLACSGCFRATTVIRVNGDGSGTIVTRTIVLPSAAPRLRQIFAALGAGDVGDLADFNPTFEPSARRVASELGATFVSSTPIDGPDGRGREATFAFANINALHMTAAQVEMLVSSTSVTSDGMTPPMSFELRRGSDGSATLKVGLSLWDPSAANPFQLAPPKSNQWLDERANAALVRDLVAGAHLTLALEPNGAIVRANTPYVEGRRVTLFDLELERVTTDEFEMKMAGARTDEERRAVLSDAGGAKIAIAKDITIEFTPFKF